MAIIQTTDQIRYLRRKNLEEEARVVGNYYSDIISQYGIDCVYHKMDMSQFTDFRGIVDSNAVLRRAYGYDITPSYEASAEMVAFAEVDADVFNLNKIGLVPNTDINLVFDRVRFACDMAPAVGRLREYKVDRREVVCEVPDFNSEITSAVDPETGLEVSGYLSDDLWPFELGLGCAEAYGAGAEVSSVRSSAALPGVEYTCGVLEGRMRCALSGWEPGVEATVVCDPYEHADFGVEFPKNGDLYYSLKHKIENDDYLETMLYLTYRVDPVEDASGRVRNVLSGYVHGSVLFFDLEQLRKYSELIHPMVGDLVDIDFPDENNRERYEITECTDRQLTQDGVNPLLHKYVWKCKARRYINSHEEGAPAPNEADERLEEFRRREDVVQEEVAEQVSMYEDLDPAKGIREDAVYGGYDGVVHSFDKHETAVRHVAYDIFPGQGLVPVMQFGSGSSLRTDGYDLLFVTAAGEGYVVAKHDGELPAPGAVFESGTRWLKATDSQVVFVDVSGQSSVLATDVSENGGTVEIPFEDLRAATAGAGEGLNEDGDCFYKFGGTRTYLIGTADGLYARLKSDGKTYKLV